MESNTNTSLKIIMLGEYNAGKTSLIYRYTKRDQEADRCSPSLLYQEAPLNISGQEVTLRIWDTSSQERYIRKLSTLYFHDSHGALVVYDVTSRTSFEATTFWLDEARIKIPREISVILVGNKSDLASAREVSYEEGVSRANECGVGFIETSADDCTNVEAAFTSLAAIAFRKLTSRS
mmetsp:Transcript_23871/g.42258  ORF Transcript_23871/g.42258 Transcript_23871/m.42258 type:complete len:178 (+) Transcript_23871:39-572(+)